MKYLLEVLVFCAIQTYSLFLWWLSGNEIVRSPALSWSLFISTVVGGILTIGVAARHIK